MSAMSVISTPNASAADLAAAAAAASAAASAAGGAKPVSVGFAGLEKTSTLSATVARMAALTATGGAAEDSSAPDDDEDAILPQTQDEKKNCTDFNNKKNKKTDNANTVATTDKVEEIQKTNTACASDTPATTNGTPRLDSIAEEETRFEFSNVKFNGQNPTTFPQLFQLSPFYKEARLQQPDLDNERAYYVALREARKQLADKLRDSLRALRAERLRRNGLLRKREQMRRRRNAGNAAFATGFAAAGARSDEQRANTDVVAPQNVAQAQGPATATAPGQPLQHPVPQQSGAVASRWGQGVSAADVSARLAAEVHANGGHSSNNNNNVAGARLSGSESVVAAAAAAGITLPTRRRWHAGERIGLCSSPISSEYEMDLNDDDDDVVDEEDEGQAHNMDVHTHGGMVASQCHA